MRTMPAPETEAVCVAEPGPQDAAPVGGAAPARPRCQRCGAVARVQVLAGYSGGVPVVHQACLACADVALAAGPEARPARSRLRGTVLLAGAVLLAVGLLGDWLVPDGHAGFGWQQRTGVLVGVVVTVVGLLVRTSAVALLGAYLAGAALLADWTGLTRGPGIGWKQQVVLAVGLVLVTAVALRAVAARRRRAGERGGTPATACATLA